MFRPRNVKALTCSSVCSKRAKKLREAVKAYNVDKTPTIYLLNKEGRIIAKNLRGKELEMKVEGHLN